MELLGIGPLELIVIVIIALIIFSPKDLGKGGKEIGRWINRLYRSDTWKSMRQVSQEMQDLPAQLAREAQLDELKDLEKDINLEGVPPKTHRPPVIPRSPAVVLKEAEMAKLPKADPVKTDPVKSDPDAESSPAASSPDPMDQKSANPEGKQ